MQLNINIYISLFIHIILFHHTRSFLFSVIISIYNTARYLDDSIGSLLNQTLGFQKIQLILVNDGSTDESEDICLKYKKLYNENIVYIKLNHSGVSKARNIGMKFARGKYINFLDSDDKWHARAFQNTLLFFHFYKTLDLISGRIKFFESNNGYHFLDYKFQNSRVVNLSKEYNCIQLHVSSSFFRSAVIKRYKFDENLFVGEDVKFISNLLLLNPIIGFIKESVYFYRKRADSTSAMQDIVKNANFYLSNNNEVQLYLINKSKLLYKKVIPFIQFYISYEIIFRLASPSFKIFNSSNYKKYCYLTRNLLYQVDDKYILEQNILSNKLKIFALSLKHNRDIRYDIILKNATFTYLNHIILDAKGKNNMIKWKFIEIKNNILRLEGEDRCWMPRESFYYYCKIRNRIFYPKYYFFSDYDFVTLYGVIIKGRTVSFEIELDNNFDKQILSFYISYLENNIEIFPSLSLFTHLPSIQNSY